MKNNKGISLIALVLVIILVLVVIIGITMLIINLKSKESGNTNNIADNLSINNSDNQQSSIKLAHELCDTSKFDPNLFDGTVYDENLNSYKLEELLNNSEDGIVNIKSNYFLTTNIEEESEALHEKWNDDNDQELIFLLDTLGNPSTVCEKYYYTLDNEKLNTGTIYYIYNYNNYFIEVDFYDYRQWEGYDYTTLILNGIKAYTREKFINDEAEALMKLSHYGENLL